MPAVYAVVKTGGKQYRVRLGQRIEVERVAEPGREISLQPVLFVDGERVLARPEELASAAVTAVVVDEHRGRKINGFTYKNKTNQRRRWGHRQTLATIEITAIEITAMESGRGSESDAGSEPEPDSHAADDSERG